MCGWGWRVHQRRKLIIEGVTELELTFDVFVNPTLSSAKVLLLLNVTRHHYRRVCLDRRPWQLFCPLVALSLIASVVCCGGCRLRQSICRLPLSALSCYPVPARHSQLRRQPAESALKPLHELKTRVCRAGTETCVAADGPGRGC